MKLSHVDQAGHARMVDVGAKPETERTAVAEGAVSMSREAYELIAGQAVAKGDVLAVAEVAGVLAPSDRRADPALSPDRARCRYGGSGSGAGGPRRAGDGLGEGDGAHRSGDGGAHRGGGGLPDSL